MRGLSFYKMHWYYEPLTFSSSLESTGVEGIWRLLLIDRFLVLFVFFFKKNGLLHVFQVCKLILVETQWLRRHCIFHIQGYVADFDNIPYSLLHNLSLPFRYVQVKKDYHSKCQHLEFTASISCFNNNISLLDFLFSLLLFLLLYWG